MKLREWYRDPDYSGADQGQKKYLSLKKRKETLTNIKKRIAKSGLTQKVK